MPVPILVSAPVPLMTPPGQRIAAVERQVPLSTTSPVEAARGAAVAELQGAGGDRRAAGIGVGAGERQRAGAALGELPVPVIDAGIGERVAAIEDQRAVVDDVAGDRPVVPPLPICRVPAVIVVLPV